MSRNLTHNRPTAGALILALAALPLALSAACDDPSAPDAAAELEMQAEAEGPDAEDEERLRPLADGEEQFGEDVTNLVDIEVGGSRLVFLRIDAPVSGDYTLVLMEEQRPGGVSLGLEPALANASMLDTFLAVTGPEVEIPDELFDYEDHQLGPRGWFADRAGRGEYPVTRASCIDATFQSELRNWDPSIDGFEEWFLNASPDGPKWYGPHVPNLGINCPNCSSIWYDYLRFNDEWEVSNVDAHKQQTTVCNVGTRPVICDSYNPNMCLDHLGPELSAEYRTEGNANRVVHWRKDLAATDEGKSWRFHWTGTSASGNNDWDWKWEIDHAVDADLFDIGYISEHHGW